MDPIADMLTRMRNGIKARKGEVLVPHSKVKEDLLSVLKETGYIREYKVQSLGVAKDIVIGLKYNLRGESVVSNLQRRSTPGCRIFLKKDEFPKICGGLGLVVLSTSKGVMSAEKAIENGVGGEYLCSLW